MSALSRRPLGTQSHHAFRNAANPPAWAPVKALDLPCPDCGAQTRAYYSKPAKGERARVCSSGHRWLWDYAGLPVRRLDPQKPHGGVCKFPDCGRPTAYAVVKARNGGRQRRCDPHGNASFCVPHARQRTRLGREGMKPVGPARRYDGICPRCAKRRTGRTASGAKRYLCLSCARARAKERRTP